MYLRSFIGLIQFTTILPVGRSDNFEDFARHSYLFPVAGYLIGGIVAACLIAIPAPLPAAALAVGLLLLLTGCHHLDGLMDLGDGLMAHGGRERRIAALLDRQVGAGGIALALSVILVTFASLASVPSPAWAIILAEVGAKFAMALLSSIGIPFREGIHSAIHSRSRWYFPLLSVLCCLPLILLPLPPLQIGAAAAAMFAVPLLLSLIARRTFGGMNGDVVGAAGEITRAAILFLCAVLP